MEKGTHKKLFTAEIQRMRAKGGGAPPPPPPHPSGEPPAGSGQILDAIGHMRDELRTLSCFVRGEEPPEHDQHAPEPGAAPPTGARQKAEVTMLKTELRALAVCIEQTKVEIAALRPKNAEEDRLVAMTSELDAIVKSTERATHTILESSERIDTLAGEIQAHVKDTYTTGVVDDIREHIVNIFEACNFQDITGQRITKVVNTLMYIEDRVNAMIDIWGREAFLDLAAPVAVDHEEEERKLLNGPALENQGISQSDIDKLFG